MLRSINTYKTSLCNLSLGGFMKRTFLLSFFVFAICFPTFLIADIYDDFTLFRVSLYNKENIEEVSRALSEWENNFIPC